jgi:hypothetical protein
MSTTTTVDPEVKDFADLLRRKVHEATGGHTGERITVYTRDDRKAEFERWFPNREYAEDAFDYHCVEVRIVRTVKGLDSRFGLYRIFDLDQAKRFNLDIEKYAEMEAGRMAEEIERAIDNHRKTYEEQNA